MSITPTSISADGDFNSNSFDGGIAPLRVTGSDASQEITGSGSSDVINGLGGDDTISANHNQDTVFGGDGDDVIKGNASDDKLFGEGDNDTLEGGVGNDRLFGGVGEDVIMGGDGDDVLFGGERWVKTGDGFADTFVFDSDDGRDQIWDFETGVDTIELTSGIDENMTITQVGNSTHITYFDTTIIIRAGNEFNAETDLVYAGEEMLPMDEPYNVG